MENSSNKELFASLAKFHKEMASISIRKDGVINSKPKPRKYATYDSIMASIREPLANNGLFVAHWIEGKVLFTMLGHESGAQFTKSTPLVDFDGGYMNNSQAQGAAITYTKRYAVSALLSLATEEDDDATSIPSSQQQQQQPKKKSKPRITKQALDGAIENILNAPNGLDYTVARIKGKYVINQQEEADIVAAIEARKRTDKLAEEEAAKVKEEPKEPEAPTDQIPF